MIIDIDEELYNKVKQIIKGRNTTVYKEMQKIVILDAVPTNTLSDARDIKTKRLKEKIRDTIKKLIQSNIKPTKYKIHKDTNIAYITLNKYYDEILKEVLNNER